MKEYLNVFFAALLGAGSAVGYDRAQRYFETRQNNAVPTESFEIPEHPRMAGQARRARRARYDCPAPVAPSIPDYYSDFEPSTPRNPNALIRGLVELAYSRYSRYSPRELSPRDRAEIAWQLTRAAEAYAAAAKDMATRIDKGLDAATVETGNRFRAWAATPEGKRILGTPGQASKAIGNFLRRPEQAQRRR